MVTAAEATGIGAGASMCEGEVKNADRSDAAAGYRSSSRPGSASVYRRRPPSLQEIALTLLLSLRFMSLVFEEVSAFIGIGLDLPGIGRDLFCDGLWYWGLIGSRYLCLNQCRLFHPWCGPWCAMCGALMC